MDIRQNSPQYRSLDTDSMESVPGLSTFDELNEALAECSLPSRPQTSTKREDPSVGGSHSRAQRISRPMDLLRRRQSGNSSLNSSELSSSPSSSQKKVDLSSGPSDKARKASVFAEIRQGAKDVGTAWRNLTSRGEQHSNSNRNIWRSSCSGGAFGVALEAFEAVGVFGLLKKYSVGFLPATVLVNIASAGVLEGGKLVVQFVKKGFSSKRAERIRHRANPEKKQASSQRSNLPVKTKWQSLKGGLSRVGLHSVSHFAVEATTGGLAHLVGTGIEVGLGVASGGVSIPLATAGKFVGAVAWHAFAEVLFNEWKQLRTTRRLREKHSAPRETAVYNLGGGNLLSSIGKSHATDPPPSQAPKTTIKKNILTTLKPLVGWGGGIVVMAAPYLPKIGGAIRVASLPADGPLASLVQNATSSSLKNTPRATSQGVVKSADTVVQWQDSQEDSNKTTIQKLVNPSSLVFLQQQQRTTSRTTELKYKDSEFSPPGTLQCQDILGKSEFSSDLRSIKIEVEGTSSPDSRNGSMKPGDFEASNARIAELRAVGLQASAENCARSTLPSAAQVTADSIHSETQISPSEYATLELAAKNGGLPSPDQLVRIGESSDPNTAALIKKIKSMRSATVTVTKEYEHQQRKEFSLLPVVGLGAGFLLVNGSLYFSKKGVATRG